MGAAPVLHRRFIGRTLRSRLTLLIAGALIIALVAFSVALYLALARGALMRHRLPSRACQPRSRGPG
jgi:ABC-type proline/glycine betaine transport system permease subunit